MKKTTEAVAFHSDLSIFDAPPLQTGIVGTEYRDVFPSFTPTDSHVEFLINGNPDEYVDLNDTLLYLKVTLKIPKDYVVDTSTRRRQR